MAQEPENAAAREDKSLIVVDFAKPLAPLTWLAIAVGAALILFSILGARPLAIAPHVANLLVGSGVSIVLAAFGGQAVVRGKSYVFAGVAGIALGLVTFLSMEQHKLHEEDLRKLELQKKSYLTGRIDGLPLDDYDVKLALDDYVSGKHPSDRKWFDFVIFKDELDKSGSASLEIEDKHDESNSVSLKIPKACLAGFLGEGTPLQWTFDRNRGALVEDGTNAVIAVQFGSDVPSGECQKAPRQVSSVSDGLFSLSWISPAFAGNVESVSPEEIDKALGDLQSEDADIRRRARVIVSRAEPEKVADILRFVREKLKTEQIYRTKLGVSLALTEMLRHDKSLRDRMKFEQSDLEMLLDFAGSDDRLLRVSAGEFLFDLENTEVAQLALRKALNAPSDDARYNWILVSKGGWLRLSDEEKAKLSPVIEQLRATTQTLPKTAELLQFFEL